MVASILDVDVATQYFMDTFNMSRYSHMWKSILHLFFSKCHDPNTDRGMEGISSSSLCSTTIICCTFEQPKAFRVEDFKYLNKIFKKLLLMPHIFNYLNIVLCK